MELYPNHEDFAVRTMGMPGLGALGVTFGNVVAMDSPSARAPGTNHWASTMWHELSHVYVLNATHHRVPRWFTEGMAVHEETAVSPDWGDRLTPDVIKAIADKKLLPVATLDRGYIHPSYPSQVIVSYFQGGQICDFINQKWGYDAAARHDACLRREKEHSAGDPAGARHASPRSSTNSSWHGWTHASELQSRTMPIGVNGFRRSASPFRRRTGTMSSKKDLRSATFIPITLRPTASMK